MAYDARFGPSAQIPEQRALVLAQMRAALPGLKAQAPATGSFTPATWPAS